MNCQDQYHSGQLTPGQGRDGDQVPCWIEDGRRCSGHERGGHNPAARNPPPGRVSEHILVMFQAWREPTFGTVCRDVIDEVPTSIPCYISVEILSGGNLVELASLCFLG